jgi:hypothetical protein
LSFSLSLSFFPQKWMNDFEGLTTTNERHRTQIGNKILWKTFPEKRDGFLEKNSF